MNLVLHIEYRTEILMSRAKYLKKKKNLVY
jgi:hypothetical protein